AGLRPELHREVLPCVYLLARPTGTGLGTGEISGPAEGKAIFPRSSDRGLQSRAKRLGFVAWGSRRHYLDHLGRTAMKSQRRKRRRAAPSAAVIAPIPHPTFSSDLLTPEEERELLAAFWDCKTELVKPLIRSSPRLRQHKPPFEPWPMAQ